MKINGVHTDFANSIENGYVKLEREWTNGDTVQWVMSMPILRMEGHPMVRHTAGKVALQRGPFVYCLEETDNGASLHQLTLPMEGKFDLHFDGELLGGIQTIIADAVRYHSSEWNGALYRNGAGWQLEPVKAVFIPYYAWANRGLGEMNVWVRQVR